VDDAQTKQDSLEKPTSADNGSTPNLYTKDQLEESNKKAVSDAKANWGREKDKEWQVKVSDLETKLKATQQEYESFKEELERKEMEANPDLEKVLFEKKALRKLKAEVEAQAKEVADTKAKMEAEAEKAAKQKIEDALDAAAIKHSIPVDDLRSELADLGISDPAKFDKIASRMTKGEVTTKPDSGLGVGMKNWRNVSPMEKIRIGMAKKPK
jgi:chromosome segregation ATPase